MDLNRKHDTLVMLMKDGSKKGLKAFRALVKSASTDSKLMTVCVKKLREVIR